MPSSSHASGLDPVPGGERRGEPRSCCPPMVRWPQILRPGSSLFPGAPGGGVHTHRGSEDASEGSCQHAEPAGRRWARRAHGSPRARRRRPERLRGLGPVQHGRVARAGGPGAKRSSSGPGEGGGGSSDGRQGYPMARRRRGLGAGRGRSLGAPGRERRVPLVVYVVGSCSSES